MYQTTRLVLGVLAREWSHIGVPNVHVNNYLVSLFSFKHSFMVIMYFVNKKNTHTILTLLGV